MSVFEPGIVRRAVRSALATDVERDKFDANWDKSVADHISTWSKSGNKTVEDVDEVAKAQIAWSAEVVAYVSFLFSHAAKAKKGLSGSKQRPPFLKTDVPILGPRFVPPSLRHVEKRSEFPDISPEVAYLQPLNVVHPFYTPSLAVCPRCRSSNVRWDGWTSTGPRNVVYGVRRSELAIGYQLRCNNCQKTRAVASGGISKKGGKKVAGSITGRKSLTGAKTPKPPSYSCSTTNPIFWEKWEYWEIPRETPIFFKRCAVTRELLDMILELRLSSTSRGLAENIKQLHLLEYHQAVHEYLECFERRDCWYKPHPLKTFSDPWDEKGYNAVSITGDLITEIILDHSRRTRQEESSEYLRTLTAKSISIDATFKASAKATVTDHNLQRTDPHKGGIMSALNENNLCMKWELSSTQSNGEIQEFLEELGDRMIVREEPPPDDVIADNCCQVRRAIENAFPGAHVGLDVYHCIKRYSVATVHQTQNPWHSQVAKDLRDAILISPAEKGIPAKYRTKEEQEARLQAVYTKWAQHGNVWTAAAAKVHADQLRHVRNGCLERKNQDIATDGSRIEGSHKGWNSIMRSHASGIEMFVALGHDHVLRRNIRVALRHDKATAFDKSTHGSHNIRLVNRNAETYNSLLSAKKKKEPRNYRDFALRPELPKISRKEQFGLVRSAEVQTFSGLIKEEEPDDDVLPDILELVEEESDITYETVSAQLQMERALFITPDNSSRTPATMAHATEPHPTMPPSTEHAAPGASARPPLASCGAASDNFPHASTMRGSKSAAPATRLPEEPDIEEIGRGVRPRAPLAAEREVMDLTLDGDSDDDDEGRSATHTAVKSGAATVHRLKRKADSDGAGAGVGSQLQQKKARAQATSPYLAVRGTGLSSATEPGHRILSFFKPRKPPSSRQTEPTRASKPTGPAADGPASTFDPALLDPALFTIDRSPSPAPQPTGEQPPTVAPSVGSFQTAVVATRTAERRSSTPAAAEISLASQAAALLRAPLPLPPASPLSGLTRSERMFLYFSKIDPRAMRIEGDIEFFVFMDARHDEKWATFSMTARKYVVATAIYNERLLRYYDERNLPRPLVLKHPRAIVKKLAEIEAIITNRILKQDFTSKTGSTTFWTKHCGVIPLVKTERGAKLRAPQTCKRCKAIKYTTGVGGEENHRRLHCSDGVRSNMRVTDKPPPWPQPEGIWTEGKKFHVVKFINTIIAMYEATVLRDEDLATMSLEYDAFRSFLERRLFVDSDGIFFPLYAGYEMVPDLRDYLVEQRAGKECLRISCLSGGDATSLQMAGVSTAAGTAGASGVAA